jgi:carbon starvation protein
MALLAFLFVSFLILATAYRFVGQWLHRLFALSSDKTTPAYQMRDGLDYEPARTSYLLPQHFSAIAAAGPIVGPILAATYFGWLPTWIWIIFGAILVGGIHDFVTLVGSVRHRARSIAEIVRQYMNPRAYLLFLLFVWFALIYVIIAFTDITAATFVTAGSTPGADAPGPAVATSSLLYLGLALLMGAALRFTGIGPLKAKLIFLPLVFVAIIAGQYAPAVLPAVGGLTPQVLWGLLLLAYCFFAAMAPLWLLLQPRGELGGYFLYFIIIVMLLGVIVNAFTGTHSIQLPSFTGWEVTAASGKVMSLFPILFITVACGACSGFHSIIASGTTSKQLECEADARPIGYGSMLLEAFFACITLVTVMVIADPSKMTPNAVYATGVADFARGIVGVFSPMSDRATDFLYPLLLQFALLCYATFIFDTLDACTRLARFVLMEALGWTTPRQVVIATAITLVLPVIVMLNGTVTINGVPQPLWRVFWEIFGSSNQLLAALTLLALTVWLARTGQAWWLTLPPTILMLTMTIWSLVLSIAPYRALVQSGKEIPFLVHMQFAITVSLLVLAAWLIVEALLTARQFLGRGGSPQEVADQIPA